MQLLSDGFTLHTWIISQNYKIFLILFIESILPAREVLSDQGRAQNTCEPAALKAEFEDAGWSKSARS
jgi:hypothetical protein